MARFIYTAEKADGEVYKGTSDARDRFDLYRVVRGEGAHIISFSEQKSSGILDFSYWNEKLASIKEYDKILFARNLGAMLGAGLSLVRALGVIERQTKNPRFAGMISQVESDVRRGEALHLALTKYPNIFSKLFIAMVRSGDEAGDLPASLSVIADQMERMYILKKKIRGALIYPAIVVVAMAGITILMMIKVVPTLAQTFKEMNATLPVSTQVVISVSNFLVEYTFIAVLLFAAFAALAYFAAKTGTGKRFGEFVSLHSPIIGTLTREVNAARTSRTLASLLSAGVDVLTALDIAGEVVQNGYFREVIRESARGVGQGEPLSAAFVRREDLYPPFVGEMMAVGEETGQSTEMLKRLAMFYEDEVDRKTKDMSTVIEPFLMVLIGTGVGFFAMAMITPIYSLSESIG